MIESLDLRAAAHRRMLFELMDGVPAETARVAAVAIGGTMLTALALWTVAGSDSQRPAEVEDVIGLVIR